MRRLGWKRLRDRWRHWQPWIVGTTLVLSGNWAASAIDAWLRGDSQSLGVRVAQVALFVASILWLHRIRRSLWRPRTRYLRQDVVEPRPHLVLFLSPLVPALIHEDGTPQDFRWEGTLEDVLAELERYKESAAPRYRNWPWEMALRAVRHHAQQRVLQSVTLICSQESLPYATRFVGLMQRFAHGKLRDVDWFLLLNRAGRACRKPALESAADDTGWDFEDFDQLGGALRSLWQTFRNLGLPEQQIVIDFTGGTKVASAVAVGSTYDLEIKAQYVQTRKPWGVIGYDLVLDHADTGGLGM